MNAKTTPKKRFAAEHGIAVSEVYEFARLAELRARYCERAMNGDEYPYPGGSRGGGKNEWAAEWDKKADALGAEMESLARGWGFHHVDFGVGLYPTLQRGESDSDGTVMFPY